MTMRKEQVDETTYGNPKIDVALLLKYYPS